MLREYKEEIEKLRQALLDAQNNNSSSSNTGNNNTINNNDNSNMIDFAALAGNNNNNNNDNNQEINNDVKINEMNAALEEERKAREDMALKLQQMQARFLGMNIDSNIVDNNVNNIDSTNEDAIAKATAIAAKREQERLEAERLHWERKQISLSRVLIWSLFVFGDTFPDGMPRWFHSPLAREFLQTLPRMGKYRPSQPCVLQGTSKFWEDLRHPLELPYVSWTTRARP